MIVTPVTFTRLLESWDSDLDPTMPGNSSGIA